MKNSTAVTMSIIFGVSVMCLFFWLGDDTKGSPSGPYAGIAHMTQEMYGCQSLDTDHQITHLLVEHDESAAEDFIRANIATGECAELGAGETVYVEDFKISGLKKVRPQGSTESYWTVSEVIGQ